MTDFSDAISATDAQNQAVRASVNSDTSPDQAARAFMLESLSGAPAQHIAGDMEGFEQGQKDSIGQDIIKNNGYIADFVRAHPLHGALVSDDLGNLDNMTKSYERLVSKPGKAALKGFAEGFGDDAIGSVYPNYINTKNQALLSLAAPIGIPFEIISRAISGGLHGIYEGTKELTGSEYHAREAAALAESIVINAGAEAGRISPKEFGKRLGEAPRRAPVPAEADAARTAALQSMVEAATKEAGALRPWAEAGEEPPPGVSQAADQLRPEAAKLDQDVIKKVLDDANAVNLKERSPDKFGEFLDGLPEGNIKIDKEAIAGKPEAFKWIPPEDLDSPLTYVEVPAKEFIANFDKEFWPDVKDSISRGGLTADEAKELKTPPAEGEEPLAGIRRAANLDPPPEMVAANDDLRFGDFARLEAINKVLASDDIVPALDNGRMKFKGLTPDENEAINRIGFGRAPDVTYEMEQAGSKEAWKKNLEHWKGLIEPAEPAKAKFVPGLKAPEGPVEAANQNILSPPKEPPKPPGGGPPPSGTVPPAETPPAGPGGPFTEGKAIGRTKPMYAKYLDLIRQRDEEDVAWRQKRAERQAARENTETWKAREKEIEPEIRDQVNQMQEIAAWKFFDKGEIFGQKMPRRPKLDRLKLTEDQFNALPESWIRDGGLDPDTVASSFNYSSGTDLADALAAVARETQGERGDIVDRIVKARVKRQLTEELGESARDNLEEAADHALSLTQMEMLHERIVGLGQELGQELPLSKADMDAQASTALAKQKYGGLSSYKLLGEAGKLGRQVEKLLLSDKPLDAFRLAQNHYITTAMAKEMRQVEKEGRQFEKDAKKFRKRDAGPDTFDSQAYTNWVHDILIRVGRPVWRSLQDLQKEIGEQPEKTLADFLLSKRDEGKEIGVPEFLIDPKFAKPVEQQTVAQARQTFAAIRSLIKVGRDEGQVEIQGEKMAVKDGIKKADVDAQRDREADRDKL